MTGTVNSFHSTSGNTATVATVVTREARSLTLENDAQVPTNTERNADILISCATNSQETSSIRVPIMSNKLIDLDNVSPNDPQGYAQAGETMMRMNGCDDIDTHHQNGVMVLGGKQQYVIIHDLHDGEMCLLLASQQHVQKEKEQSQSMQRQSSCVTTSHVIPTNVHDEPMDVMETPLSHEESSFRGSNQGSLYRRIGMKSNTVAAIG
jgi:hypothetical protein